MPPFVAGTDETCSMVGGLPAVVCATPAPVVYEVPIQAGWNLDALIAGPAPYLAIGATLASISPAPVLPLHVEGAISLVTNPDLTVIPPDNAWQVAGSYDAGSTVPPAAAALLPLAFLPSGVAGGGAVWVRVRTVDGNGCETRLHAVFPEGIPAAWDAEPTVPVTLYLGFDTDTAYDLTIAAPPTETDPGPVDSVTVNVSPVCPPAKRAVAVAPACEFPVQIDTPISTVPTAVAVATPFEVETTASDPGDSVTVPAGWSQIVVNGYGPAGTVARVRFNGTDYVLAAAATGLFGPVVLDAPAGLLGPEVELQVWSGAPPTAAGITASVLTPPS